MTAILKVDTIQDTAGNNIINENANTVTIGKAGDTVNVVGTLQNNSAALVTGKILQFIMSDDTNNLNTTGTSFVTGGTGLTITPSSTSSKIYISVAFTAEVDAGRGYYTIYRDTTNVNGSAELVRNQVNGLNNPSFMHYLDSPSTTSAITYKIAIRSQNSGNQTSAGQPLVYTAMEIGT